MTTSKSKDTASLGGSSARADRTKRQDTSTGRSPLKGEQSGRALIDAPAGSPLRDVDFERTRYEAPVRDIIAVAEKHSALETEDYFKEPAKRGGREAYLRFLDEAVDEPPAEGDQLP
jgi:hypothetical protein